VFWFSIISGPSDFVIALTSETAVLGVAVRLLLAGAGRARRCRGQRKSGGSNEACGALGEEAPSKGRLLAFRPNRIMGHPLVDESVAICARTAWTTIATVESAKRLREGVAIRTQDRQVIRCNVAPIAIDMLDFYRDVIAVRVALGPTTALTVFAERCQKMSPDNFIEEWTRLKRSCDPCCDNRCRILR